MPVNVLNFSTKLVESLSTATPVICNYTSDIDKYIQHMKNGIVVNGEDQFSCLESLRCVIGLDRKSILEMQKNARYTSEKYFDYRIYADRMIEFIEG